MSDFSDWKVIDTYSTKQAVQDGCLIKVDQKISKEAGIRFPVYLTRAVWDKYVEVPDVPNAGQSIERHRQTYMKNSEYGRFRCIHCGSRFDLDDENQELYEEGWFNTEPDCCDDCSNDCYEQDYECHSDADPGL